MEENTIIHCPKCGAVNEINSLYCCECGYKLDIEQNIINDNNTKQNNELNTAVQNQGNSNLQNTQYNNIPTFRCPYCGSEIRGQKTKKCPHCGEWLRVSHFGCGSLLMLISVILGIVLASTGQEFGIISGFVGVLICLFYFVPSLIADMRGHDSKTAIFMVNLLLGWLLIPWFICLIWSFSGRSR